MENFSNPSQPTENQTFLKNVPVGFLLVFVWFAYSTVSALLKIPQTFLFLSYWWQPEPLMLIYLYPLPLAVLNIAILWGLYKQRRWVKILLVIWYLIIAAFLIYTIYPLLSSVGYFSPTNEFYFGGIKDFLPYTIPLVSGVINLTINTVIVYYLFKKVNYQ